MARGNKYLSNVLQSIKYATIETVAEMNPVIVETYKDNKDFFKDTLENLKEKRSNAGTTGKEVKSFISDTYRNALDDLHTGKFYNKERKEAEENAAMSKAFGVDFDFDFGDDGGMDDDWDSFEEFGSDDSTSSSSSSSSNNDIDDHGMDFTMKAMGLMSKSTTGAIDSSNRRLSSALGGIMAHNTKFSAEVVNMSTNRVIAGINTSTAMIHRDLTAMNQNIAGMMEFVDSAMRTHVENSTTFYETQKQQMQEQTDILKEMYNMQKKYFDPDDKYKRKTSISDIFGSNGGISLSGLKDYIKDNGGGVEGSELGMLGMVKDFLPMITGEIKGSPLAIPLKKAIKKAIPETVETLFENLNTTISGVMSTSMINLTHAKKGKNGDFFSFLGDMLGLKIPELGKMSTGNYEKGPVPWNGKDHKALTEVIPKYLSDIYSAVSGREGSRFDYETGKYVKNSEIKKKYKGHEKSAIAMANQSINKELKAQIDRIQFSNADDKKQILNAIEKIQEYNFKNMKNFNPNDKNALDPKIYGIDGPNADKIMDIVKILFDKVEKRTLLKGSGELLESISRYDRELREREAAGDSLYNSLFDDSMNESDIIDTPIMASAKRLDYTNILLEEIRDSVKGVSFGGSATITTTSTTSKKKSQQSKKKNRKNKRKNTKLQNETGINEEVFSLTDDPVKFEELLAQEDPEEITETYTQSIANAQSASDKLGKFFRGFTLLTKKPMEFMRGALDTVDRYTYDLFFGDGSGDVGTVSGKIMDGFKTLFGKISGKVSETFNAVASELKKEGKTTLNDIFKAAFGLDAKDSFGNLKEALFGDRNTKFLPGFAKLTGQGLKEIASDTYTNTKRSITSFFSDDPEAGYSAKFKTGMSKYSEAKAKQKEQEELRKRLEAGELESVMDVTELKNDKKNKNIPKAAQGGRVTKTGIIAVSEGERIIPDSMNPSDIKAREIGEENAIGRFNNFLNSIGIGEVDVNNFARGGKYKSKKNKNKKKNKQQKPPKNVYRSNMTYEEFNEFYRTLEDDEEKEKYTKKFAKDFSKNKVRDAIRAGEKTAEGARRFVTGAVNDIKDKNPALADTIDRELNDILDSDFVKKTKHYTNKAFQGAKQFGIDVKDEAKGAFQKGKELFIQDDDFGRAVNDLVSKFMPKDTNVKMKDIIGDITQNYTKYLPKILGGGALGGGLSLLLGLAGGPLVGAGVGAAIGLTSKSETIQKLLFGEKYVGEDGKEYRKGNVFSKDMANAIQKYAPDIGRGGLAGIALSMMPFIPGGPVAGLIMGSSLGFAKNNEEIQNMLYGTKKSLKSAGNYVKKKLPAIGLGALTGALTGPFGLTTNLILGSALGLASDTDKFKRMIFGVKGLDGKYAGGLVGVIKDVLTPPLQFMSEELTKAKTFFSEEVFNPLKKAAKPFIQGFENIFNRIHDSIADSVSTHITKPIGSLLVNRIVRPIEKFFLGTLGKGALKFGKGVIKTGISPFIKVGRAMEKRQLNRIGYSSGSAADRIARRQELIDDYNNETDRLFDPLNKVPFLKDTWITKSGRRKSRGQRWDKKLQNSESMKLDEFLSGRNTDDISELLMLSKAAGKGDLGKKKGVKNFATHILGKSKLPDVLANLEIQKKLSVKIVRLIRKEVAEGKCEKSVAIVTNNSGQLTDDERTQLITLIEETAKSVKEGIEKAEKANETMDQFELDNGFSIRGAAAQRALEQELRVRGYVDEDIDKAREAAGTTPNEDDTPVMQSLGSINDNVDKIYNILAERFGIEHKNLHPDVDEDGIADAEYTVIDEHPHTTAMEAMGIRLGQRDDNHLYSTDFSTDTLSRMGREIANVDGAVQQPTEQYQYTENGIVKLVTNDQGELEVDDQDTETRETQRKRDEEQQTQKGILGKLSGIGTSLLDFFGGNKDKEKKPSILSKILSVLGMGFGFLGGGKILKALKIAAGVAIGGYAWGKLTEKDENGESLAGKIGEKVKEGLGTVWDKATGWWKETAWPWIKNTGWPTVKSGLQNALETALNATGWLADALVDFTVAIVPRIISDLASSVWTTIKNGIFGTDRDDDEKMDNSDIDSDDQGNKTVDGNIEYYKSTTIKNTAKDNKITTTSTAQDGTTRQVRTQGNCKDELKNSIAYKKCTSDRQKELLNSNLYTLEVWDAETDITDPNGIPYTVGELCQTEGIPIYHDTETGLVVNSENVLAADSSTKKIFSAYGYTGTKELTTEERDKNTGGTASGFENNVLVKFAHSAAIDTFTKGTISNTPLKLATGVSSLGSTALAAGVAQIPLVGPSAAAKIKIDSAVALAPQRLYTKITDINAARSTGASLKDSITYANVKSGGKAAKKATDAAKELTDNIDDILNNTDDYINAGKANSVFKSICTKIKEKICQNEFIEKVVSVINKGIDIVGTGTKVTNTAMKNALEKLADRLEEHFKDKIGSKIAKAVASKIKNVAAILGTAGVQLIAALLTYFTVGYSRAEAYFEVEEATFGEKIVGGITNAICEVLLKGWFTAHDLVSIFTDVFKGIFDFSELEERRQKLRQLVALYNEEQRTNISEYDFMMYDTLEGKLSRFAQKNPGIVGTGNAIVGHATGLLATIGLGLNTVIGGVAMPIHGAVESIAQGSITKGFGTAWNTYANNEKDLYNLATESATQANKDFVEGWSKQFSGENDYHEVTETPEEFMERMENNEVNAYQALLEKNNEILKDFSATADTTTSTFTNILDIDPLNTNSSESDNTFAFPCISEFSNGMSELNDALEPLNNILKNNSEEIADLVSKALVVRLGLATPDEDVTLDEVLNDDKYLEARESLTATDVYNAINEVQQNEGVTVNIAPTDKSQYSLLSAGGSGSGMSNSALRNTSPEGNINPAIANFVSQNNGKIANMTFGKGVLKQTVSDAGCAPTAAMMAINANIDRESSIEINEALKTAGGYMATTGGVTADYFADEFGKHGFKTAYVPRKDKNQKKILLHQLSNGVSVVLMGKDESNNSKKKSPFGPTYHYVVATGLSDDGKFVYINDPESKTPNTKYPVDNIFNNSDLSIIPVKTRGRIGSIGYNLKSKLSQYAGKATPGIIFVGDSRTVGLQDAVGKSDKKIFIAESGKGYVWMKSNIDRVKKAAATNSNYYIVFNMGVNDLGNIDKYISYYKELQSSSMGSRMYFMSVNPVDETKYTGSATNSKIHSFNEKYKEFAGDKYIDICTWMETEGFEDRGDGLHYSASQYTKIYNKTVEFFEDGSLSTSTESSSDSTSGTTSTTKIKTISDLISAVGSILGNAYGLSSSEAAELTGSSSGSSSNSTYINTDGISGPVSTDPEVAENQKKIIAKMKSIEGKIPYSQTGPRDPDKGSSDCSATVRWAYKKVMGKDVGSWTGAQEQSSTTTHIDKPHKTRSFDESKMQLGDLLLYGTNASDHVELYYGNGKVIGHGSGNGPKVRNLSDVHKGNHWSVKRLKEFMPGGKGTGLFVSQNDSKWANNKIGDETVSVAGCAPAVATMAINNTEEYNMKQAIKDAEKYKSPDKGGVSATYFIDTFKKQGYNTIVLKEKDQILNVLAKGKNVVLIGQDTKNKSKRRSPFGSGMHYVLATGISADREWITINDPELSEETKFKTDLVFNGVILGIIPVSQKGNKLNDLSNSLRDALGEMDGRGNEDLPTSTNPILVSCAKMTRRLRSDKAGTWVYRNNGTKRGNWDSALKDKIYATNCALFAVWALKDAGIMKKSSKAFYGKSAASDGWTWEESVKNEILKTCELIMVNGAKSAATMAKNGELQPGDIISYSNYEHHTNIYAGNGNKWYDAGHAYCSGSGEGAIYKDWFGTQNDPGRVKSIIRYKGGATSANASTIINKAIDWAKTTANDSSHGYDNRKDYRGGPDYACSSFVNEAFRQAGVTALPESKTVYTSKMKKLYTAAGFEDVSDSVNFKTASGLEKGDVLVNPGQHTELYLGNKKMVGARGDANSGHAENGKVGDQTGGEIATGAYSNNPWKYALRFKGSGDSSTGTGGTSNGDGSTESTGSTWLDKITNTFALLAEGWGLTSASTEDTTVSDTGESSDAGDLTSGGTISGNSDKEKIWNYLIDKGISKEGVAGLMGNFQAESGNRFNNLEDQVNTYLDISDEEYTKRVDNNTYSRNDFLHPKGGNKVYGYGLAQWTSVGRKAGLYDKAKSGNTSIADPQTQMDWLWHELSTGYKGVLNTVKNATSIQTASDKVLYDFEAPANASSYTSLRASYGQQIYNELAGKGSGLSAIGIPKSSNSTIRSINRINKSDNIAKKNNNASISIYGKGSGLSGSSNRSTSTSTSAITRNITSETPIYAYTQNKSNNVVLANTDSGNNNRSSDTTNTLLNAILNLLTQEVKNTAFIEGIANAIVSLVDAKATSTDDVSTKKQLLDTKAQILNLVRQQNTESASTSLSDLITSMESIIAQ